jgi:hypothetical protein
MQNGLRTPKQLVDEARAKTVTSLRRDGWSYESIAVTVGLHDERSVRRLLQRQRGTTACHQAKRVRYCPSRLTGRPCSVK